MADDAAARLTEAFAARGLKDARDAYRARLRALRAADPEAFARATAFYEDHVTPRLESDEDPLEVWIDYGRMLGELNGPGRLLAVDASGRARPYQPPLPTGTLLLFVPDERNEDVLAAMEPASPSAAQRATYGLLVERKLGL